MALAVIVGALDLGEGRQNGPQLDIMIVMGHFPMGESLGTKGSPRYWDA
jgi:hypothetical protein